MPASIQVMLMPSIAEPTRTAGTGRRLSRANPSAALHIPRPASVASLRRRMIDAEKGPATIAPRPCNEVSSPTKVAGLRRP